MRSLRQSLFHCSGFDYSEGDNFRDVFCGNGFFRKGVLSKGVTVHQGDRLFDVNSRIQSKTCPLDGHDCVFGNEQGAGDLLVTLEISIFRKQLVGS